MDRTSQFAFVRIYRRATSLVAAAFLTGLAPSVPYRIHSALTGNGIQFGDAGGRRVLPRRHPLDRMSQLLGIEHRPTSPYHPGTTGRAERMIRTLREATVRAFHYDDLRELRQHVADYLAAYNLAKPLKALRWRTRIETLQALRRRNPNSPDSHPATSP